MQVAGEPTTQNKTERTEPDTSLDYYFCRAGHLRPPQTYVDGLRVYEDDGAYHGNTMLEQHAKMLTCAHIGSYHHIQSTLQLFLADAWRVSFSQNGDFSKTGLQNALYYKRQFSKAAVHMNDKITHFLLHA